MQKCLIKYSENEQEVQEVASSDALPNIPRTTNALSGFYTQKYANLEKSTNYITPKTFLKHKITDSIYSSIIIG